MLDFAALPPEVNSTRMYSGPGSSPMLAAAAAWRTMGAELRSAAASYGAVVSELTSESWLGASSTSMVAAAAPYLAWLSGTAAQAEQAGAQAHAAAAAYESAFAMTVPPSAVAANRAELAMLVATNVFGQNTPAIAATEAEYAEMWAQDAAAMNGYANATTAAMQLTPFTGPRSSSANGVAGQAATVAQAAQTPAGTVRSTLSSAASGASGVSPQSVVSSLAALLSGSDNSALGTFLNGNFFSTGVTNGALAGGPFNPQFILGTVAGFNYLMNADKVATAAAAVTGVGDTSGVGSAALVSAEHAVPGAAGSVQVGHARLVGSLSVPPSWASAATISHAGTAVPANGLSDIGTSPTGGPGGFAPVGATGARRRRAIPKYGFRPVVMPRPPAAG